MKRRIRNWFYKNVWVSLSTPDDRTADRALVIFPFTRFSFVPLRWRANEKRRFEQFLEKWNVNISF